MPFFLRFVISYLTKFFLVYKCCCNKSTKHKSSEIRHLDLIFSKSYSLKSFYNLNNFRLYKANFANVRKKFC